jgi:hypothetical protein
MAAIGLFALGGTNTTPPAAYIATAHTSPMVGNYDCRANACTNRTRLRLLPNGHWAWSGFGGEYVVTDAGVKFSGTGGPSAWGAAKFTGGTLTFTSTTDPIVYDKGVIRVSQPGAVKVTTRFRHHTA